MRRRVLWLVAAAVALAAFCVELQMQWGGVQTTNVIDDLAELAAAVAAAIAGVWRAHLCRHRLRASWALIAAGCACWAAGQAIWSYYELLAHRQTPFPSLADAGFLAFPILALIGLLVRPAAAFNRHGRPRVVLDSLLVAASLFVLSWVTAFGQTLHAGGDSTFALAVSLAYPLGDLLLLTVSLVVLTHAHASSRTGLQLLIAGFAALSVADSGFAYLSATGTYGSGNLIDAGWLLGFAVIAVAAISDRATAETAARTAVSKTALLLPYLPAGLGLGLAALRLRGHHSDDVSLLTAVVIVSVLLARQLLVIRDNLNLVTAITRQALYDPLTGLANRSLFADRLEHALELHQRDLRELAILFCDLDDFKLVNDTLGHATGDELLTRVAERLRGALRPGDTLARLGGDEFGVLLEDGGEPVTVAERMKQALDAPFTLNTQRVSARASIGIAAISADQRTPSSAEVMASADIAMYRAKKAGKHGLCLYLPGMNHEDAPDFALSAALTRAIENAELTAEFQPIVNLATGTIHGVEALARWRYEDHDIPPSTFIPIAERHGLIRALTDHMLNTACAELSRWRADLATTELHVGVNIHAELLADAGFPDRLAGILHEHNLPGDRLILELTEDALISHPEDAKLICQSITSLGVGLSLDDFGTGYSSLARLRTIPLQSLKLDKSFIDAIGTSDEANTMLEAILMLAHQLGLRVVAEGVEHLHQHQLLKTLDCDFAQGFLIARPLSAAALSGYLVSTPNYVEAGARQ
jgi:diguanylate cyclase